MPADEPGIRFPPPVAVAPHHRRFPGSLATRELLEDGRNPTPEAAATAARVRGSPYASAYQFASDRADRRAAADRQASAIIEALDRSHIYE